MGNASDNYKVTIEDGDNNLSRVYGRRETSTADATDAEVQMTGGEVEQYVYGGGASSGKVSRNKVYISGGYINYGVTGGYASTGNAEYNEVHISGGTLAASGDVAGGQSGDAEAEPGGNVSHNTVSISNVTAHSVYGGYAMNSTGSATHNTVTLGAGAKVTNNLYGGYSGTDAVTGNTLNVQGKDLSVREVYNFDTINFTLPDGFTAGDTGDTALNITGSKVDLTKVTTIDIDASGLTTPLAVDDQIKLISQAEKLDSSLTAPFRAGNYEFALSLESDALVAKVTKVFHTIKATPIGDGNISCDPTEVEHSKDVTIKCDIAPTSGNELEKLEITGGGSSDSCNKDTKICEAKGVTSDLTVTATFKPTTAVTYTVTPVYANGVVKCNGSPDPIEVAEDPGTVECTAEADLDYELRDLKFKGSANGSCDVATKSCSLTNVTSNLEVTGTFALKTYTVSVQSSPTEAPRITCDKTSPVEHGDIVTCSYTPDANWTLNVSGLTLPSGCAPEGTTAVTCTVTAPIDVTIPFDRVDSGGDTPGGDTPGSDTPGGDTPGGDTPGGDTPGGDTGGNTPGGNTPGAGTSYSDDSSPTMGELGLLLSGLALAGAAAPALRRREKQGKKTDTRQ